MLVDPKSEDPNQHGDNYDAASGGFIPPVPQGQSDASIAQMLQQQQAPAPAPKPAPAPMVQFKAPTVPQSPQLPEQLPTPFKAPQIPGAGAPSVGAPMVSFNMNKQSAFEQGFQKRASEYGFDEGISGMLARNPEAWGTILGGGAGAGAGALLGGEGKRGKGALIGGVAGAGLGLGAGLAYHQGQDMRQADVGKIQNKMRDDDDSRHFEQTRRNALLSRLTGEHAPDKNHDFERGALTEKYWDSQNRIEKFDSTHNDDYKNLNEAKDKGAYRTLLQHLFGGK